MVSNLPNSNGGLGGLLIIALHKNATFLVSRTRRESESPLGTANFGMLAFFARICLERVAI